MNLRSVIGVLGFLLLVTSASLLVPAAVAWLYREADGPAYLAAAALGALLGGGALRWGGRAPDIRVREGFAVVTFGWLTCGLFGALPLWWSGQIPAFTDAAFESISGFTTTGASILADIESRSHAALLWRALTQWLGGMGIVLLAVAVLPLLGIGGMQLYRAEVPGPVPDKLTPRVRDTARRLWGVYLLLTVAETLALVLAGMGAFDAVCHSLATMATGGFSPRNLSLAAYASPAIEWIVAIFMLLAGTNFSLHYLALTGRPLAYARDDEWRFYAGILLGAAVLMLVDLLPASLYPHAGEALRHALFQVVSICTTTGFTTADYGAWPPIAHAVLLVLMFVGGCAGSTGGGIKVMRVLILLKQAKNELRRLLHPRAVIALWFNGRVLPAGLPANVLGFFLFYVLIWLAGVLALTLGGRDLITAAGAVAATLGNIGPGLGEVGPAGNYAALLAWEKWLLCAFMLVGRLEIYTVLVLLLPEAWRRS